jgi:putative toxin-antitoxin system antitoxin component (TIGR02293 family)
MEVTVNSGHPDPDAEPSIEARMRRRAEEAIGSPSKADRWLQKPNRALGGRRPIDLLADEDSARAVAEVLVRIEHGLGA